MLIRNDFICVKPYPLISGLGTKGNGGQNVSSSKCVASLKTLFLEHYTLKIVAILMFPSSIPLLIGG